MLPILAGIFSAVGAAADLFDTGKRVYEQVTGKPSAAASAAELRAEVEALPPEAAADWAERMRVRVEMYRAETERLAGEQGQVSAEVLAALPAEVAGRIAWLRMATRPRIALWCGRVVMLPAFVVVLDAALMTAENLAGAFGASWRVTLLSERLLDSSAVLQLYSWAAPTAASIVVAYMGLREIGKAKGTADSTGPTVAGVVDQVGGLVGAVKRAFGK